MDMKATIIITTMKQSHKAIGALDFSFLYKAECLADSDICSREQNER